MGESITLSEDNRILRFQKLTGKLKEFFPKVKKVRL